VQKQAQREYLVRFLSAMAVYVIAIFFSSWLIPKIEPPNPIRYLVAVLPLLPLFFALAAFLQYLRRMDEMQRRIQFEAFGLSLALTGMLTFTSGLLQRVGIPPIDITFVFPMLIFFWGVGVCLANWRYR
jgi:hypothetical protein